MNERDKGTHNNPDEPQQQTDIFDIFAGATTPAKREQISKGLGHILSEREAQIEEDPTTYTSDQAQQLINKPQRRGAPDVNKPHQPSPLPKDSK